MTISQLKKVKQFSKLIYTKTGKYHKWDHVEVVLLWARRLAKQRPEVNLRLLECSVYLHDIGRSISDKDHACQSCKIALPLLKKVRVADRDIEIILEAVEYHNIENIKKAKSIEAKLLFDADKLQIVSFYGFIRSLFWLVEERDMELEEAISFLLEYVRDVNRKYLHTQEAIKVAKAEYPKIKDFISEMNNWPAGFLDES